ncbi:MAG: class II aldolase/adducin family protein [Alphaproteobacteria bacterium]
MAIAEKRDDRSVRDLVSPEEWQLRVDIAACYRLIALEGWDDLVFTHISGRVPGGEGHFLINPFGMLFEEITASSLVKINKNGEKVLESDYDPNGPGFVIHGAVLGARDDVNCVIHLHTDAGQAVSAQKAGLLPLTQTAMFLDGEVGYHDFEGVATDLDERERLVADLGPRHCMIMRNHGTLAAGAHPADAYWRIYLLERACSAQVMAQSGGSALQIPTSESIARTAKVAQDGLAKGTAQRLLWPAMIRRLDRVDPDYKD